MRAPRQPNPPGRLASTAPPLLLLFLLLFIVLIYSNTLHSPPVLDDRATFIDNPAVYIDDLSPASLKQIHAGRFGRSRFIPMLSFGVDHLLGQGDIARFHLTNIIIHLLATVAVYLLVLGLTSTDIAKRHLVLLTPASFSIVAAAFWALHPVQTNAVTYLVQRMASLAALFYFTSLAGYVWARIGKSGAARVSGWLFFCLAMLGAFYSKENTATLPLAVLLVEMILISPDLGRRIAAGINRRRLLILAVVCLLLLPFAAAKLAAIADSYAAGGRHFNLPDRLFTELRVVVFYLSLLILPLPGRLNLDHDFPLSYSLINPPSTLLACLLLGFLVWAAFRVRRRYPLAAFGILFFFLNLIIESSVIGLELVFEHRLYLPSLGVIIAIVALLDRGSKFVPAPNKKELRTIFYLGMTIIACTLAIATSLRNHTWRDKLTLYEDIALKSPNKPRVHANLGKELIKAGREKEALAALEKAINLGKGESEEYMTAANNIVTIFIGRQNFQEAADRAKKLIRERPPGKLNFDAFPLLMANLGVAYWKLGRFSDSLEAFMIGINTHHPQHTPLLLASLEAVLLDASTSEEGRQQLELTTGAESVYGKLATIFLQNNDYQNSRIYLSKALAIAPADEKIRAIKTIFDEETARNRRARAAISSAEQPAASTGFGFKAALYLAEFIETRYTLLDPLVGPLLQKAVQLEPESLCGALKLAHWQLRNGKDAEALKLAERHLPANPNSPPLLELAGQGYIAQGEKGKAAVVFSRLLEVYPGNPNWASYAGFIHKYDLAAGISKQKVPVGEDER